MKVKGDEVQIRRVTIEDKSGQAMLTLWREIADLDAHAGDYTEVTDCVINVYKSETGNSTVLVILSLFLKSAYRD